MTESSYTDFFFLKSDCLLVNGAVNAAIYCLSSGNVYSVDHVGRQVLEQVKLGKPISEICSNITCVEDKAEIIRYLQHLHTLQLGDFNTTPVLPEKMEILPTSFALRGMWLELTNRCNLQCVHCYADSSSLLDSKQLTVAQWRSIISQASDLGTQWIQFIGGEPLLYGKRNLFDLISIAKEKSFNFIEVFTNGTIIDEEHIDFFYKHGVNIALSLYDSTPEIHDEITQSPGSFQHTISSAEKLQEVGVPFRFGFTIMKQNCRYADETVDWVINKFHTAGICTDIVRCSSGGQNKQISLITSELWKRRLRYEPVFPRFTNESLARNMGGHPCLCGKICVHSNGEIYPCIMDRTHRLGNAVTSPLSKIIQGATTQQIWSLSKDRISECEVCEYRYACHDCRPMAIGVAETLNQLKNGLFSKDPCCLYNPYTGEWGNADEFIDSVIPGSLSATC